MQNELCGAENEILETKYPGIILAPGAYLAFEDLLMGRLDRHQDELDCGGFGDPKELAMLCAAWGKEYLRESAL